MRVKGEDARHLKREDVVVAYGEAKFLSALRGRPSVPVKRFRKHLKHYVTVVPTSERLTSQVCSKGCGSEGEKEKEEGKKEKGDKLVAMRGGQHARTHVRGGVSEHGSHLQPMPYCVEQRRQRGPQYRVDVLVAASPRQS